MEIKFRGWKTDGGGWLYGNLVHNSINAFSKSIKVGIKPNECYPEEVFPESVGQYINLKDKNGNEIYLGDICTLFTSEPKEVVFKNGAFGYSNVAEDFISFAQNQWFEFDKNNKTKKIQIIGNTTENLNLLINF